MNHLSLFSGIGGIDLAAHWAGFTTVAFCEQNKFCQQVLNKHWPEVPIFDDIFELSAESMERRGIRPGEIKLISGGFPCQPYSHAGKRLGNEDDRALWPQMFRVIKEVRPDWVCGENVAGLISMALDGVLSDLESEGYTCQPIVLPACAVNAPHRRDRVFIVAHSKIRNSGDECQDKREAGREKHTPYNASSPGSGVNKSDYWKAMAHTTGRENDGRERGNLAQAASGGEGINTTADISREDVADTEECTGSSIKRDEPNPPKYSDDRLQKPIGRTGSNIGYEPSHWAVEPDVGRVATGVPRRVDRLRALGNAVVPQQIYPILKAMADYEMANS